MIEFFDKETCWRVFQGLSLDQQKDIVHTYVCLGLKCVLSDYLKDFDKDKSNV